MAIQDYEEPQAVVFGTSSGSPRIQLAKHEELQKAISDLEGLNERLLSLLERVQGVGHCRSNDELPPMLPLAEFLVSGKDQVRKLEEDMHRNITAIEELLF